MFICLVFRIRCPCSCHLDQVPKNSHLIFTNALFFLVLFTGCKSKKLKIVVSGTLSLFKQSNQYGRRGSVGRLELDMAVGAL